MLKKKSIDFSSGNFFYFCIFFTLVHVAHDQKSMDETN